VSSSLNVRYQVSTSIFLDSEKKLPERTGTITGHIALLNLVKLAAKFHGSRVIRNPLTIKLSVLQQILPQNEI
jgi:hypothetical protein